MNPPNSPAPRRAMVLAAGLGKRMRPLTDTLPKPLVPVAGRTLLDRVLDRFEDIALERVVINLHHLGDVIRDHLKGRKDLEILYSEEPEILETGGGTKKALPLLGPDPFFTVNAKIITPAGSKLPPGSGMTNPMKQFPVNQDAYSN